MPAPPLSARTGPRRPGRRAVVTLSVGALAATGVSAVVIPSAEAAPQNIVKASRSSAVSCFTKPLTGAFVDTRSVTSTVKGVVQARLTGGGDWDLAVFDSATKKVVAGSAGFRTNELAEGFVTKGQKLLVQACRFRGTADRATLTLEFFAAPTPPPASGQSADAGTDGAAQGPVQLVEVSTPKRADKQRLQGLGLDLTEHGDADSIDVVLRGRADAEKLRAAGFRWTVEIADMAARTRANRATDARYAAAVAKSPLPSGRTAYRRLFDYQLEMKQLSMRYPSLVKPLRLPEKSIEGRDVEGVEITTNAANIADGKPVFFNMGVHHAREWPAGEHPMEFAQDLVKSYGSNKSLRSLISSTRTIVVPIVNPDGFNVSREAPSVGATYDVFDYEYKRKNCRATDSPEAFRGGTCGANPAGRLRGTDPNRNYAGFWGGPGASPNWSSDIYRGAAPFSEPETRNVRAIVSRRQVTTLITNHTFSNLILRPPGVFEVQPPLDEPVLRALGARMASRNGYANIPGYQLYDTTGTTEDWSFWNTGGLAYTFEIGSEDFHPAFQNAVVAEYVGLKPAAGAGKGGNRAAYFDVLRATANTDLRGTIQGTATKGTVLRVHKEFTTPTSPVIQADGSVKDPIVYKDVLDSTMKVTSPRFRFAVNPSTRPYVAGRLGRDPLAPPQAATTFANPEGVPAENQNYPITPDPATGPAERIPFTVSGLPGADNETADVSIQWSDPSVDWDLYIYDAQGREVASSATFGTTSERARVINPVAGQYTAVIVNYEGGAKSDWTSGTVSFTGPRPARYGPKETWTLTCETPKGKVLASRQVYVDRGQVVDVGNACVPRPKVRAKR